MKVMTEELKFADLFPEEAGKLAQRLHIKKEEIPFIRKSFVSEKSEVKPDERAVISYISTIAKDRDGEQLLPEGVQLDNYRKNPIVLWGHKYDAMPIGKNLWIKKDEKGLIAKTVFAKSEKADEVFRAYTEDVADTGPLLKAFSVGFIPVEFEDTDQKELEKNKDLPKRIYKKWELLEYSTVPIPSCPEALTLAVEKGLIPEGLQKDFEKYIEVEDFQEEPDGENETKTMTPDELKEHYRKAEEENKEIEVEIGEGEIKNVIYNVSPEEKETDLQDAINELVEEGVEDIEDLAFDEVEEKRFDLEGNPSVWDIMDAISLVVRTPMNSKTSRYVADLYPTKYPDGHVVIEEMKEKEQRKYLLHSYEYNDGIIKLGESKELEATYKPKERDIGDMLTAKLEITDMPDIQETLKSIQDQVAELKEGRVLSRKHRGLVKNCTEALLELLKADAAGSREDEEKDEDEKEVEIEIEKGEHSPKEIQAMIAAGLKEALKDFDINKSIDLSIKKLKGKVE